MGSAGVGVWGSGAWGLVFEVWGAARSELHAHGSLEKRCADEGNGPARGENVMKTKRREKPTKECLKNKCGQEGWQGMHSFLVGRELCQESDPPSPTPHDCLDSPAIVVNPHHLSTDRDGNAPASAECGDGMRPQNLVLRHLTSQRRSARQACARNAKIQWNAT